MQTLNQTLPQNLFAFSIIPYAGFLYHLTRSKQAPPLTLFGFYFLLVFVFATIPAGIYGKAWLLFPYIYSICIYIYIYRYSSIIRKLSIQSSCHVCVCCSKESLWNKSCQRGLSSWMGRVSPHTDQSIHCPWLEEWDSKRRE